MTMNRKIEILDTTLRDGCQGLGISFTTADKLKIIECLSAFGVDYIEAGSPGSNPKDVEVFQQLSLANSSSKDAVCCEHCCGERGKQKTSVVAFGATVRKNLSPREDESIAALLAAGTDTVVVFGKSSVEQVERVLGVTLEENISMVRRTVEYLIKQGRGVIFDAEHFFDGYKHNPDYAFETLRTAVAAGANTVVLCDTNGGSLPDEVKSIVSAAVRFVSGLSVGGVPVKVGIHCHDDTGCAVANTIAAVNAGVIHVQGTFTGIGERCGNANLSTVIPNLQLKMKLDCVDRTSIGTLTATARFIAQLANVRLAQSMPYVGAAAFAHKGGMHIDGVVKHAASFEHVPPETVGNERTLLLSEVSGRGALLAKIKTIAPNLSKEDLVVKQIIDKVKELEHDGYQFEAAEASFELLVLKELGMYESFFKISDYDVFSSPCRETRALVRVCVGDKYEMTADYGNGPVNAVDKAFRKALQVFYPTLAQMKLIDFKVQILDSNHNTAATTRVLMESCCDDCQSWTTIGVGDNVIDASVIALADAAEYMLYNRGSSHNPLDETKTAE